MHICRHLTHNIFGIITTLRYSYNMYRHHGYNHGWFPRGPYGPWGGGYPSPGFYPPIGLYPPPGFYPPIGLYPPLGIYPTSPIYPPFFR